MEWGGLKTCQVLADFFLFLNKRYIVHFSRWSKRVGGDIIGHIIGLNILKLHPTQLLEAVVSS